MKFAVISDIHGNLTALEAVLADIKLRGADEIVCLGDIVGYGPKPRECLHLVREICTTVVQGNHDAAFVKPKVHLKEMGKMARSGIKYTATCLDESDWEYLHGVSTRLVLPEASVCLAHGSYAKNDVWTYVDSEELMAEEFAGMPEDVRVCLLGHTHVPLLFGDKEGLRDRLSERMLLDEGERFVINVGSVGQPRDGDCRARYGLFEIDGASIRFDLVYVFYDIPTTGHGIDEAGLPKWLHERLYCGD